MDERDRYEQGMAIRREVFGDAHVDAGLAHRNAFNAEMQDLIARYAFGEIWSRPGLPRATRSLITMAMLLALHRDAELRLHVRAALRIGVTRDELKELLLMAAIYCGIPAAHSGFRLVEDVLAEVDRECAPR